MINLPTFIGFIIVVVLAWVLLSAQLIYRRRWRGLLMAAGLTLPTVGLLYLGLLAGMWINCTSAGVCM